MGDVTKGYTFGATELVTNTKLHALVDDSTVVTVGGKSASDIADTVDKKHTQNTDQYLDYGGANQVAVSEIVKTTGNQTIAGVKTFSDIPKTDAIAEKTADTGVTVDGCLIKDGKAADSDKLDGYDYNATEIKPFGVWATRSENTVYQATTDGFFIGLISGSSYCSAYIIGYSDSSNPPTTVKGYAGVSRHGYHPEWYGPTYNSFCIPIRKGYYYKATAGAEYNLSATTRTYYWIPLGS